tara:strand:- start:274 stop:540 length:267 start_codon:yes stop_codon:yes gene_type:complete
MKPSQTYKDIVDLLEKIGIRIILDKGNFKSAPCVIEDENVVVINKNSPMENRIQVLSEFLSKKNIKNIFIKPYLREIIEQKKKLNLFL